MKKFLAKFKPKPVVAVVPLKGVIGVKKNGITLEQYNVVLENAFKIKPKCVVLLINSPGGSPVQSDLITTKIKRLANKHSVPVYAYVEDVAASGGYYIASAATEIVASENSIVGSIGVISAGFGFEKAINKLGVERRVYTSGKNKSILDPFLPENPDDISIIKDIQSDIFDNFKNAVSNSRGEKLKEDVFNGRVWSGKKALAIGLIDKITDLDSFLEDKFGDNFKIQKFEPKKKGLLSKLSLGDMLTDVYQELKWLR